MKADSFDHHVKTNDVLRNTLLQFTAAFVAQVSLSGACKRLHSLKAQYSRLLLMLHDRAAERSFFLKQDSVAHMLGVRRMSITQVAGQLHDEGLISYSRGTLVIEDRRGLQRAACECYARICDVYRTLLPTDH
jgi:CRP-like cAMP-binding protein